MYLILSISSMSRPIYIKQCIFGKSLFNSRQRLKRIIFRIDDIKKFIDYIAKIWIKECEILNIQENNKNLKKYFIILQILVKYSIL